jgi:hypothetical protein
MPLPVPGNPALTRVAHYVKSALALPSDELILLRRFIRLAAGELAEESSFPDANALPELPSNLGPGCAQPADTSTPASPPAPTEAPVTSAPPDAPASPPTVSRAAQMMTNLARSAKPATAPAAATAPPASPSPALAFSPAMAERIAKLQAQALAAAPVRAAGSPLDTSGLPSRVASPEAGVLSTHAPTVAGPAALAAGDARSAVAGTEEPAPQTPREGSRPSRAAADVVETEGQPSRIGTAPSEVPTREPQKDVTIIPGLPARI